MVEKVAKDPLGVAGDAETAAGVTAAASPWWLGALAVCPWCTNAWVTAAASTCWPAALAVCPWCTTAWWTAWATGPAPDRTTRSSRHDADPDSDGTKRRLSRRDR